MSGRAKKMDVQTEFCPHCRTATAMNITVVLNAAVDKDGRTKLTSVKTYYCASCRLFVRSAEEEPVMA